MGRRSVIPAERHQRLESKRSWISTNSSSSSEDLILASYNILANFNETKNGGQHSDRLPYVTEDIRRVNPDICILQEVEPHQMDDLAKALPDYRMFFSQKAVGETTKKETCVNSVDNKRPECIDESSAINGDKDGNAILWKRKKFRALHVDAISLDARASTFGSILQQDCGSNGEIQFKTLKHDENQFGDLNGKCDTECDPETYSSIKEYQKGQTCQAVVLERIQTRDETEAGRLPKTIVIGNTHLLFNPERGDIKFFQLFKFQAFCYHLKKEHEADALFMGGDLNLVPQSQLYAMMTRRVDLSTDHDFCHLSGQRTMKNHVGLDAGNPLHNTTNDSLQPNIRPETVFVPKVGKKVEKSKYYVHDNRTIVFRDRFHCPENTGRKTKLEAKRNTLRLGIHALKEKENLEAQTYPDSSLNPEQFYDIEDGRVLPSAAPPSMHLIPMNSCTVLQGEGNNAGFDYEPRYSSWTKHQKGHVDYIFSDRNSTLVPIAIWSDPPIEDLPGWHDSLPNSKHPASDHLIVAVKLGLKPSNKL